MVGDELGRMEALVDAWSPGGDGDEVARAWALIDRLTAKATAATGRLDATGAWELDGATSLRAWLQHHAGMTAARASHTARLARRCRAWPTTAQAWEGGALTSGQIDVIAANVAPHAVARYTAHERHLTADLAVLSTADTATAMRHWRARAEAELDHPHSDPASAPSRLHCSKILDGRRRLDADLSVEDGEILDTALRHAHQPPTPDEADLTPAQQRAHALISICRAYLDQPATHAKARGRARPHLNIICDLDTLYDPQGLARLLDGTPLDQTTSRRLLCDAAVHRTITKGPSIILDHGRATRTVPDALYHALVVRDRGCRFPGCDRPPQWTEAHHLTPWYHDGPTNLDNLVLLCTRHHHLTHAQHGHRHGWELHLHPNATLTATSPEGTTTHSRPPP